ncbi:murein biosynthesis integral membrane protein MurJ [Candidatus Sumerlaeota bacterium]|nr:murein biosynthesis integral membrane protein MurJ [Candidatus Sumerlaeota bacterium]
MSEKRKILKTTGLLGLLTLLSRFTGLIRDMMLAALLGGTRISDVFYISFELSNLARRVLGEGSLSSFVVPLFEQRRKESDASAWKFVNRSLNAIGLLTVLLTLAGMIFSRQVFDFFGGFGLEAAAARASDPAAASQIREAAGQGVELTRLMFPNLIALAVGSIMMGVCNALGSFTAPAMGSVVLNITMIFAGGLALAKQTNAKTGVIWLAWSVLAGAALRVLLMVPAMIKAGWRYRFQWRGEDHGVAELFRMMGAGLFGMSINQINMSMISIYATFMGAGNKTFLVYANRLIQFPMALTATAMATAMLPQITRMMLDGRHEQLREVMGFIKRVELVLMLPAALGLMFFGLPIVQLIFQRGEFSPANAQGTYGALLFYSPALIAFGWSRLVLPLYYAKRDVATPVKAALCSMLTNMLMGAFFTFCTHLQQKGLALSNTLAAFVDYSVMTYFLRKDPSNPLALSRTPETFYKCLAAGVISIGGMRAVYALVASRLDMDSSIERLLVLIPFLALSGTLYFGLAHLFRVPDSDRAFEKIKQKIFRRRETPRVL